MPMTPSVVLHSSRVRRLAFLPFVRKMRVMQIALSLAPGGTERLVVEIVRFLHSRSIDSVVCCLDTEGAWAEEVRALDVPVLALQRRSGFRPGLGRAIARLAARYDVDVVHAHHYSSFVYGQLSASVWSGPPVIFTEHGRLSDARPSRKRRLVNPLLGRLPQAVYAVSEDLRRHMIEEGFPPPLVGVIHNGIEPGVEVTDQDRLAARHLLKIPSDALVVGTVGRLDPVKDFGTLVRGFGDVRTALPNGRLVIIGDGPERDALHAEVRTAGLEESVVFTGHRQDARALLPAFDLYVNSSIHEGVSLTLLEAMAAATPCIATSVGGNPEVVTENSGVLVPPRSPGAIGRAVLDLARNRELQRRLGSAGRTRVLQSFSAGRMFEQYLASYQEHCRRESAMADPSGQHDGPAQ
jgi:glycosyltransferase involved in cell wall biosynthesis